MHLPALGSPALFVSTMMFASFACGPSSPGQEDGGDTGGSSQGTDPGEGVPTTSAGSGADGCGPCWTIFEGHLSPAGDARIDGFIVAVEILQKAVASIRGDFDDDMRALAELYGIPEPVVGAALVSQLATDIEADVAANTTSFRAVHVPGACHASIELAVEAQRSCERGAGCDLPSASGRPPVLCEGTCLGACAGSCAGPLSCVAPAPGVQCEGTCVGSCTAMVEVECAGACHGACAGLCSQRDSNGDCAGRCDGPCLGNCVEVRPTPCFGGCNGACRLEQGSAACTAESDCAGDCQGACTGECVGKATPPSASPECAASSPCQPQAAAQGLAGLQCTPPRLELHYAFALGLDPGAQGAFSARMRELERRSTAILQGAAALRAIVTGEVDGELAFDPPPLSELNAALTQLVQLGFADMAIPAGRLPCVEPAVLAATEALGQVGGDSSATIEAQSLFVAFLIGG